MWLSGSNPGSLNHPGPRESGGFVLISLWTQCSVSEDQEQFLSKSLRAEEFDFTMHTSFSEGWFLNTFRVCEWKAGKLRWMRKSERGKVPRKSKNCGVRWPSCLVMSLLGQKSYGEMLLSRRVPETGVLQNKNIILTGAFICCSSREALLPAPSMISSFFDWTNLDALVCKVLYSGESSLFLLLFLLFPCCLFVCFEVGSHLFILGCLWTM